MGEEIVSTIESQQKGVVRTNCIDCLDRTNVAQQMICLVALQAFNVIAEAKENWFESFIYQWAMSGDNISKMYSGTPSNITSITLKGYQTSYDKV